MEAHPLKYFRDHLPFPDSMTEYYFQHKPKHSKILAEVKLVGRLADQRVFDVFYKLDSSQARLAKLILIGSAGLYKPVVWIDADMAEELDDSEIAEFKTRQILGTRCREQWSYFLEDYFIFDPVHRIPINLRVDERVETILSKMGWHAWIGGNFDLWTLTFKSRDLKDQGWYVIEFRLSKAKLIAKSVRITLDP